MPTDREILALAIPALGALIAEPLYVLGDTAIIGHLGTVPLAGLALSGLLLSEVFGFCTFLEYGTTARAARLYGAGQVEEALDVGVQATWLALALGVFLTVGLEIAAAPAMHAMAGGSTPRRHRPCGGCGSHRSERRSCWSRPRRRGGCARSRTRARRSS